LSQQLSSNCVTLLGDGEHRYKVTLIWTMHTLVVLLWLAQFPSLGLAYCFQVGYNPFWKGPPIVEQVTLTSVRVSWAGLLELADCADNILVKHYKGVYSSQYKLSDPLSIEATSYIVHDLSPNLEYTYQVIAREEKGLLGVDYNRGEKTTFTTSLRNRQKGNEVKKDDPIFIPDLEDGAAVLPPQSEVVTGSSVNSQDIVTRTVKPVYDQSQFTKQLTEEVGIEMVLGIIVGVLIVLIITVGVVYNWLKKEKQEKDLELDSDMYDEDEESEEDSEASGEEDEFKESAETKKYNVMTQEAKLEGKLMRPLSVP